MNGMRTFLMAAACVYLSVLGVGAEDASVPIRVALHAPRPVVTSAELVFLELELANETDQTQYLYAGPEKDFAGRTRIRIRHPDGHESVVESPAPDAEDDPSLSWLPLKPGVMQRIPLPLLNTAAHPLVAEGGEYQVTAEVDLVVRPTRTDAVPGAGQALQSDPVPVRHRQRELEEEGIALFSFLEEMHAIALHNIRLHRSNRGIPEKWRSVPRGDARGVFVDASHRYELSLSRGKRHLVIREGTAADAPILFEGEGEALRGVHAFPEGMHQALSGSDYPWNHIQILMTDGMYLHTEFVRQGGHVRFRPARRAGIQFQFQRVAEVLY